MLGEVGDAAIALLLVARARGQHDEAGDRLRVRHRRGEDAKSVIQRLTLEDSHAPDAIEAPMPGETRRAVFAQPDWLRAVPTGLRLPEGARVVFTGCGTSFHAAQTGGWAMQSLEAVLAPPDADVMVCVSHEGSTLLTLEAARAFRGPVWLVTGKAELAARGARGRGRSSARPRWRSRGATRRATPARSPRSRRCAARTSRGSRTRSRSALAFTEPVPSQTKILVAGAGRDWPTAQEAVLKLREGAWISAGAHQTEQLLHGHLAAIDETVRAYVLEGEGRAGERARDAAAALRELGCETTLVPTQHPVVDIVRFHLLTLALAEAKGIDPDPIHRDDPRWARARAALVVPCSGRARACLRRRTRSQT